MRGASSAQQSRAPDYIYVTFDWRTEVGKFLVLVDILLLQPFLSFAAISYCLATSRRESRM